MNASKNHNIARAKYKLAAGILAQARRDLRRFRGSTRGVERELYLDAYDWVISESFRWPFSFRNVCKVLKLTPEIVRHELLHDASLGLFQYWSRRFGNVLRRAQTALDQIVRPFDNDAAGSRTLAHTSC
jgi:hypothetical protein